MSTANECGGAPIDDEPTCPECGEAAPAAGARCDWCIEDDPWGDLDEERKMAIENDPIRRAS